MNKKSKDFDIWDIITMVLAAIIILLVIAFIVIIFYAVWTVAGILASLLFAFMGFAATTTQYISMQIVLCILIAGIINTIQAWIIRIRINKNA